GLRAGPRPAGAADRGAARRRRRRPHRPRRGRRPARRRGARRRPHEGAAAGPAAGPGCGDPAGPDHPGGQRADGAPPRHGEDEGAARAAPAAGGAGGPSAMTTGPTLPTTCAEVRELAPDIALGLLTGEERAAALAHLERCGACRAEVVGLAGAADEVLLLAPGATPPPG